jgi:predicted CxxxxCH...CXXCH cytochrome family protein
MMLLLMAMILTSCSTDRTGTIYQTHPTGWADQASANFHGVGRTCADCHRSDFATVDNLNAASCRSCHKGASAQLACVACHGTPPVDNGGLPLGFEHGAFGAHGKHARFGCAECHANPGGDGHAVAAPADVNMTGGGIAAHVPFTQPAFSGLETATSGNGTCSAVYCHSDGHGGGPMRRIALPWVGGQIACGDCHSIPPTTAWHPEPTGGYVPACSDCHSNVDPASNFRQDSLDIRFFNDTLHVNGVVDL